MDNRTSNSFSGTEHLYCMAVQQLVVVCVCVHGKMGVKSESGQAKWIEWKS